MPGIELATAYVSLTSDTRGLGRQITRDLQRPVGAAGKQAGRGYASAFTGGLSGIGGALAAAGVGIFLKQSKDAASDLNESMSKTKVVFGDAADGVVRFSSDAARSMGMSQQAALEASSTFGNLFVSMGLAGEKSSDMSTRLVKLAGDLASFNNTTPTEALEALRSGLVGEVEPLRRFGVNLNDAQLRQEALALGLVKTTKDVLPPAIRSQAAYSLILKQTKTAQGDFARTADGAANKQRIMAATLEDTKAKLGRALVPAYIAASSAAIKLLDGFNRLSPSAQSAAIYITAVGTAALVAIPHVLRFGAAIKGVVIGSAVTGALANIGVGASLAAQGFGLAEIATLGFGASLGAIALPASVGLLIAGVGYGVVAAFAKASNAVGDWLARNESANAVTTKHNVSLREQASLSRQVVVGLNGQTKSVGELTGRTVGAQWATKHFGASAKTAGGEAKTAATSVAGLASAMNTLRSGSLTAAQALLDNRQAHAALAEARKKVADLMATESVSAADLKAAQDDLTQSEITAEQSDMALTDSKHKLGLAIDGMRKKHLSEAEILDRLGPSGAKAAKALGLVGSAARKVPAKVAPKVSTPGASVAREAVARLNEKIRDLPRQRKVHVHASVTGIERVQSLIDKIRRAISLSRVPLKVTPKLRAPQARGSILPATAGGIDVTAAEAGHDEAFIPMYPSSRNRALAARAAEATGLASGGITINGPITVLVHDGRLSTLTRELKAATKQGSRKAAFE